MNEKDFSQKITRYLDGGLTHIEGANLDQLRAARTKAIGLYREPVRVLGLVTLSGRIFDPAYFIRNPLFWLPVLAILVVLSTVVYNTSTPDDLYDETGALDAKLLTDELPIDAFLDKDFAAWVKETETAQ